MAVKRNVLRIPTIYERPITNPASKEPVTPVIYNVMDNSRILSDQKIISATGGSAGPLEDSLAILSAFGMTVVEESENIETTILSNKFLDQSKIQKIEKTQDKNPNRLQTDKFNTIKKRKIPASDIFNQTMNNTLNELDACQANGVTTKRQPPSNVIEITNDFINFMPSSLISRVKK